MVIVLQIGEAHKFAQFIACANSESLSYAPFAGEFTNIYVYFKFGEFDGI